MPLLDRLAVAALVLIDEEQTLGSLARLREVVEALAGIYELALDAAGHPVAIGEMARHELWTEVVVRVYAVGAYAVRRAAWEAVPVLVARDTRAARIADGDLFAHWREQATDRGLLVGRDVPLQEVAADFIDANDWARPDGVDRDAAFASVCAFDQLASLVYAAAAVAADVDLELAPLYGNAGLVGDDALRRAVFPPRDVALRRALQQLLKYARQEAHQAGRSRFQAHEWVEVDRFLGGEPSRSAPPLVAPEIVLGHPSFQPVFAIGPEDKRYVSALRPRYLIENKSTDTTIRDLTTGIRTRDGREFAFHAFLAPALRAGKKALMENVEVRAVGDVDQDESRTVGRRITAFGRDGSRRLWSVRQRRLRIVGLTASRELFSRCWRVDGPVQQLCVWPTRAPWRRTPPRSR